MRGLQPEGLTPANNTTSEARPEAGFCSQRNVVPLTGTPVTGRQPGQVFIAFPRKCDVPREPDVKMGIEGPRPEPTDFVILALTNTAARQLWCEGDLEPGWYPPSPDRRTNQ